MVSRDKPRPPPLRSCRGRTHGYHSSSLSSSIATSESLSSSSSFSSLGRFMPRLSGVPASAMAWSPPAGGLDGRPWVVEEPPLGTGALNMLCWRSVISTGAVAPVVILKVPSSLATMLDFDLAYEIFCALVSLSVRWLATIDLDIPSAGQRTQNHPRTSWPEWMFEYRDRQYVPDLAFWLSSAQQHRGLDRVSRRAGTEPS